MSYITSSGFVKKTLQELKLEREAEARAIFGNDIDLDPDQPFGQWVGLQAKRDADLWDLAEEVYNSRNPDKASGTSLDNIVSENLIERIPATFTTVDDVVCFGDEGTIISQGSRIKNTYNDINVLATEGFTITQSRARFVHVSMVTYTVGVDYTVTIDETDYTVTGATDKQTTMTALYSALSTALTSFVVVLRPNYDITITSTVDFALSVSNLDIVELGSSGMFNAEEAGVVTVPANTLTVIVTNITGWNRVNNPVAGITGSPVETDAELRIRRLASLGNIGKATETAIRSGVLNGVDGVTQAYIYSNRENDTDVEGRPAHSFELVVVGGDDTELAYKIWDLMPCGIDSYGNQSVNITDSQGFTQTINFSRAVEAYIHVRVLRALYDEESYPVNGDELIRSNIVEWSLNPDNITIGKDVIRQRLSIPVYSIPGISDITIEIASTTNPEDTPTFATDNIVCNAREIAVFAEDRVTVGVLV